MEIIELLTVIGKGIRDSAQWIFALLALYVFWRWMNSQKTPIQLWHFITSPNAKGEHVADVNKLGQVIGIAIGSFAVLTVAPYAGQNFGGFAIVLTTYFAFAGGVATFAAHLRAQSVRKETITEPAAEPGPMKKTVSEPAQPKGNP